MSGKLRDYWQKRDFGKTPEPRGDTPSSKGEKRRFVVQKHDAQNLHYDLRLELDGVLKSWAVPKEPQMKTGLRRLAVQTEDHPLEYATFEGEIPKPEYGAGSVIIWDQGHWTSDDDPARSLADGKLDFELYGARLSGRWTLVQFGQRGLKSAKKDNWLLVKRSDKKKALGAPAALDSDTSALDPRSLPEARKADVTANIQLQLATLVDEPPEGGDWIHEPKLDGYRMLCSFENDQVALLTRGGNNWTDRFPIIAAEISGLPCRSALMDGEIVVFDDDGRTSFQRLQGAIREDDQVITYVIFDLLHLNGWDIQATPLIDRKALLRQLLSAERGHLRYGDHIEGRGPRFFSQACALGLEGIISKRKNGPYAGGRSASWLKIKCMLRQEFVIIGYTDLKGKGPGIGALLLGSREDPASRLQFAGKVGTGFDRSTRIELRERLNLIEQKTPTIEGSIAPTPVREVHWVNPELVAEIAFTGWTDEGRIRHASFQGLREDKRATEVVKERPMSVAKETAAMKRVRLTNPDRILFADDGITKRDLADYWKSVSTIAMPYIGNRPLSLVRCPDGIENQCFYQKHIGAGVPEAIPGVAVNEEGDTYAMVDGVQALRGLAQIAAIELHCWGSRADDLDRPDVIVFDLDPSEEVEWPAVAKASLEMKGRLEALGLVAFAKVTGGKGVHVISPIEPGPKWPAVKRFTRELAREFAREQPDRYTDSMSKSKRVGKIFIDYLRNDRESTSIGAYSPRARAGAPVAMPVEWTELESPGESPPRYGMKHVADHLRTRDRDPWEAYEASRRSLTD